jgi:predicted nucleic acid-binding protein
VAEQTSALLSLPMHLSFEMQHVDWVQGLSIDEPVYIDANILVGSLIRQHPLYSKCANLIGILLADNVEIMLSVVAVDEATWIIAKLAYCEIYNQPWDTNWNPRIYRRQRERIFQSHESWISSVGKAVEDWTSAGAKIEVVPETYALFKDVIDLIPVYMNDVKLTPADAIHLALAQKHARSFLTADSDFDEVRQNPPEGDLVVVKVAA